MDTVFGKIIDGIIPCDKVFENQNILAFKDINPVAPVHILIVPKRKDLKCLQDLYGKDISIMNEIIEVALILAEEFGISDGYRLLTNNGHNAGQEVPHLHFHLIGGKKLGSMA